MTETEYMLTSLLNCQRVDLVVDPKPLSEEQHRQYEDMKYRRDLGEPLQYIVGECDFMGIKLKVDERALIPRPETEILVEKAIQKCNQQQSQIHRPLNILDLGTGSGNIAIALAKNIESCCVTTVDISQEALTLAKHNAKMNGVYDKINFIHADMVSFLEGANHQTARFVAQLKFDILISNPPYIPTQQLSQLPKDVQHEPRLALDGGMDGLDFYRPIAANSYNFLNREGFLFMEIGDDQEVLLEALLKKYPQYKNIFLHKDYMGTVRIIEVQNL